MDRPPTPIELRQQPERPPQRRNSPHISNNESVVSSQPIEDRLPNESPAATPEGTLPLPRPRSIWTKLNGHRFLVCLHCSPKLREKIFGDSRRSCITTWLAIIVTFVFGVLGLRYAYVQKQAALQQTRLAEWEARKDLLLLCQDEKSNGLVSNNSCDDALRNPLSSPPLHWLDSRTLHANKIAIKGLFSVPDSFFESMATNVSSLQIISFAIMTAMFLLTQRKYRRSSSRSQLVEEPYLVDRTISTLRNRHKVFDSRLCRRSGYKTKDYRLLKAVLAMDLRSVSALLDKGADANCKGLDELHVIHHAAAKGHVKIVELLVAHGASLHLESFQCRRAYYLTILHNHFEILQTLLKSVLKAAGLSLSRASEPCQLLEDAKRDPWWRYDLFVRLASVTITGNESFSNLNALRVQQEGEKANITEDIEQFALDIARVGSRARSAPILKDTSLALDAGDQRSKEIDEDLRLEQLNLFDPVLQNEDRGAATGIDVDIQKPTRRKAKAIRGSKTKPTAWFCGHCFPSPMMNMIITPHCVTCGRKQDALARYEYV